MSEATPIATEKRRPDVNRASDELCHVTAMLEFLQQPLTQADSIVDSATGLYFILQHVVDKVEAAQSLLGFDDE